MISKKTVFYILQMNDSNNDSDNINLWKKRVLWLLYG